MPTGIIYVEQDGADFYVYLNAADSTPNMIRTYPGKVSDGDHDAAYKAREWFRSLCSVNQKIVWVDDGAGNDPAANQPIKLRGFNSLNVRVTTLVESSPGSGIWAEESTKIIDHNNSSDRKWLGTHSFWALRNGRKVETYPL